MLYVTLLTKLYLFHGRVKRYAKFFGPGVTADVIKIDAEKRIVGLKLTTTSGAASVPESDSGAVSSTASSAETPAS